jgi:hypothetical protein
MAVGVAIFVWKHEIVRQQLEMLPADRGLDVRYETVIRTIRWSELGGSLAVPILVVPILLALLGMWGAWTHRLRPLVASAFLCLLYGFVTMLTVGQLVMPISVLLFFAGALEVRRCRLSRAVSGFKEKRGP